MNTYEANFNKNLGALEEYNAILADKIEDVKTNERFEVFAGKSTFDINIYDHELKQSLYDNPEKFFDDKYSEIYSKYERYPVLFFYGLGNGLLYKALLKNENHKSIVVFEPNIEVLYIVFHLIDFSEELKNKRLYVMDEFDKNHLSIFLGKELQVRNYLQNTILLRHCLYYENTTRSEKLENDLKKLCIILITELGNDPTDSLQGITQLLHNLPDQLSNPSLKDLLKQRKGKNENAIIVSTGPSLIKQLPLLKEYANKASIICADSAYPILAKYNIKPDYVLSLERVEKTSEFFNNDFGDFDKDILFVLVSLVFPKTIEYLKRNNRNFILVHRPLPFAQSLNMDDYGYLGGGMSVANMAYELAVKLEHKNIILIGQDLAYGEDGNSHPKEYHYKSNFENDRKEGLFVTAYGGNGKVETNKFWNIFKESFEKDIALTSPLGIKTFNATEGGARIEGAIEKPFKEICEELLKEDKKQTQMVKKYHKKQNLEEKWENLKKQITHKKSKINQLLDLTQNFEIEFKMILQNIQQTNNLQDLNFKTILEINEKLHEIKNKTESIVELGEVLNPALKNIELKLAKITLTSALTQNDKKNRMINWLLAHDSWIEILLQYLKILSENLEKSYDEFL
ncbi:motility accessory factor [Campylobacter peloridis]|uniref:Motility accessory factor n=1 Tax=Campylobacter peloridis TaxID=488546 RepID=A0ABX6TUD2_9BACT|nr:motility accessory factor [Campylobacter peloridis]AJC84041.1 motility accessory factor [Campylobacter peloridis LMG 23910]QOQ89630.1 motility accessory factor [Campylobacter peloridis]